MLDAVTAPAPAPAPAHLDLSAAAQAARQEEVVTCVGVLLVLRRAVKFVADLLAAHRRGLGTREGRRGLDCWDQAVAFWRWMLDGVEPERLAADFGIGRSTAHRDVNEALTVVAKRTPSLHGALLAARAVGHCLPRKTSGITSVLELRRVWRRFRSGRGGRVRVRVDLGGR